jgi:hypothetical protein
MLTMAGLQYRSETVDDVAIRFNRYTPQSPHSVPRIEPPMTRWIGAALLVILAIGGFAVARRASAGPGSKELAAEKSLDSPSRTPEPTQLAASRSSTPSAEFGLIGDAVMGTAGQTYLLDVMERRVGVSTAGDSVAWTGGMGRGPGEFFVPVALAAGADVLYVLDRGTRRIERYRTGGRALERTASLTLEFDPEDLCVSRDRVFVLGPHHGHAIHEISPRDGRVIRSLAPDPQLRDPLLASFRASGHLACGPGDEIVFLPRLLPEVLRFSLATGARTGTAALPRYDAVRIRMHGDAVSFQAEDGTHDVGASIVPLDDGRLLVQAGSVSQSTGRDQFTAIRSYVVDWDTPAARVISRTLPRIMDVRDGWALAVETDPEPAVHRIRLTIPLMQ